MREYENIAYLDLQKTGSTTIKSVLDDILDEREVHRTSHGGIYEDFDHSKLCFVSAREPMSLYISLFNFGIEHEGGALRRSLTRKGFNDLFVPTHEAFARWLNFVLDPQNAHVLKRNYGNAPYESIGFLSFRLLYLSVPNSMHRMGKKKFQAPERIRELFLGKRLYQDYVRLENLSGDLFAFLSRHSARLRFRHSLTTAEDLLARIPVKNSSAKISGLTSETVSPELRQRVREREWLFYEAFGYDTDPKGRPPKCLLPETGSGAEAQSHMANNEERRPRRRLRKEAAP